MATKHAKSRAVNIGNFCIIQSTDFPYLDVLIVNNLYGQFIN